MDQPDVCVDLPVLALSTLTSGQQGEGDAAVLCVWLFLGLARWTHFANEGPQTLSQDCLTELHV